ncbi:MAG: hypothetical protein IJW55_00640 [Clostridia bacterium]|nr:hypothetical protein [Clostridia bacterium]
MGKKKKRLVEEALAAEEAVTAEIDEATEAAEDTEATVDDNTLAENLRADIRLYEEKEKVVTEKLSLAKSKGLSPQVDRCRELLQKLVAEKQKKQAELKVVEARIREAEAKRFAAEFSEELDTLTEHIEHDVLKLEEEALPEPPSFEPVYDHMAKSKRLSVISKAFAFVGIFTGLIGALVYMIMVEFAFFKFRWIDLAIFGGIAVVMIIVGLFVGGASNKQKRLAEEIAAEIAEKQAEYEAELAERARLEAEKKAAWRNENMDAVIEAYKIEKAGDAKRARKKALQSLIPDLSKPEELKKNLHKVAPVAAACAAVAAVAMVSAGKKSAANRKTAALRREFFNWLT